MTNPDSYAEVMKAVMEQRFEDAQNLAYEAFREKPNDPMSWLLLGIVDKSVGNYQGALFNYKMAFHKLPDFPFAIMGIFDVGMNSGQYQEVISCFKKYQEAGGIPLGTQYLEDLIIANYQIGQYNEGLQLLISQQEILEGKFYWFNKSRFESAQGYYDHALNSLDEIGEISSKEDLDAIDYERARIYYRMQKYDESGRFIDKLHKANPEDMLYITFDALIAGKKISIDEVEKKIAIHLKKDDEIPISIMIAFGMFQYGLLEEGIEYFEELISKSPSHEAIGGLALLLGEKGDFSRLIEFVATQEWTEKCNFRVLETIYINLMKAKQYQMALNMYQILMRINPERTAGDLNPCELYFRLDMFYDLEQYFAANNIDLENMNEQQAFYMVELLIFKGFLEPALQICVRLNDQGVLEGMMQKVRLFYYHEDYYSAKSYVERIRNDLDYKDLILDIYSDLCDYRMDKMSREILVTKFEELAKTHTENIDLHNALLSIYDEMGEEEAVEIQVNKILAINEDHYQALLRKAIFESHKKNHEETIRLLNRVIPKYPVIVHPWQLKAMSEADLGFYDDAINSLEKAWECVNKDDKETKIQLLTLFAAFHDLNNMSDKATEFVDKIMDYEIDNADVYFGCSAIMLKQRNLKKALMFMRKAFDLDDSNYNYFMFYTRLLMDNNHYLETKQLIEKYEDFKEKEEIQYIYNDAIEAINMGL